MILYWAAQTIFWLSATALIYTYAGYPLLVYFISRWRPLAIAKAAIEPTISIIITAFNEEQALPAKLENSLQLDYPAEKLEIIVASDASTDRTDEIAQDFARRGVRLFRQEGRLGKTATQNGAVAVATNEIIVFSDATTHYQPNVLRVLAANFADQTVGCAAGKLIYVDPHNTSVGAGARRYWNYETLLKTWESRACGLIGASGCLYAVRRANYVPMYAEACSDFLIATVVREQNLRTVYEPNAISFEETNDRATKELKMRVRVITQTFTDLWRHRRMMNPFKSGFYAVELISHKLLRYSVPLFLVLLLAATAILGFYSRLFGLLLLLQAAFYFAALAALSLEKLTGSAPRLLALPQYFVLANAAAILAWWKFLRGERLAVWQPIRDNKAEAPSETAR